MVGGIGDFAGGVGVGKFFYVCDAGIGIGDGGQVGIGRTGGCAAGIAVRIGIGGLVAARVSHREALAGVVVGVGGAKGRAGTVDPARFLGEIAAVAASTVLDDA